MSACLSVSPPACSHVNESAHIGRILMKFDICVFFETFSRKLKFHLNLTRITGTLHEDQSIFMIISRSFLVK